MSNQIEPDTKPTLQTLQEQYSHPRAVGTMYMTEHSPPRAVGSMYMTDSRAEGPAVDSTRDTDVEPVKVKFVPKKDRYKSVSKVKTSRWTAQESPMAEPANIQQDSAPEGGSSHAPQSIMCNLDTELNNLQNSKESQPDNCGDPPLHPAVITPVDLPVSPEITTPPSAQSEDCWMPALPPALGNPTSQQVTEERDGGSGAHKHKKVHGQSPTYSEGQHTLEYTALDIEH